MKQEPVVFATAVEGVKRAFGPRLTPDVHAKMKAIGIDLEHIQAAYAFETWYRTNELLVEALGDQTASKSDQYRALGREFMRGFVETTIGFATLTMGKLMGIRRTMQRMSRNFRTSANYIDAETMETEAGLVIRCSVSPDFIPVLPREAAQMVIDYRRGLLEETLIILGGKNSAVEIIERDDSHFAANYLLKWQ